MHVPGRGLFRGTIGASGDIQIGEDRLRAIMATARAPEALSHALEKALGTAGMLNSSRTATPETARR